MCHVALAHCPICRLLVCLEQPCQVKHCILGSCQVLDRTDIHIQSESPLCRRLAANAGLCSAPSGINMYFSLPQCDATTLQAQQAADPAAVAGASPSSPPSSPAAGVPVQLWPTQSTTSSSGEPMRLVWPFIILGLSGLVLGVFFGLHRKRRVCPQA